MVPVNRDDVFVLYWHHTRFPQCCWNMSNIYIYMPDIKTCLHIIVTLFFTDNCSNTLGSWHMAGADRAEFHFHSHHRTVVAATWKQSDTLPTLPSPLYLHRHRIRHYGTLYCVWRGGDTKWYTDQSGNTCHMVDQSVAVLYCPDCSQGQRLQGRYRGRRTSRMLCENIRDGNLAAICLNVATRWFFPSYTYLHNGCSPFFYSWNIFLRV